MERSCFRLKNREKIFSGFIFVLTVFPACLLASPSPVAFPEATPISFSYQARRHAELREEKLRAAGNPTRSASASNRLARLYMRHGDYEKALAEYRYALVITPGKASYYHRKIAGILRDLGRDGEADLHLELASLTRDNSRRDRYRRRLADWEREGRYDLLIQEYRYLLRQEPNRTETHLRKLALLARRSGDEAQAAYYMKRLVKYYRKIIKEEAGKVGNRAQIRLSSVYRDLAEFDLALEELAQIEPQDLDQECEVALARVAVYRAAGDHKATLSVLEKLDQALPDEEIDFHRRIARILEQLDEDEKALALYRRLAEQPGGQEVNLILGDRLQEAGQLEESLKYYRRGLKHISEEKKARILEDIGEILAQLSRPDEARIAWKEALQIWLSSKFPARDWGQLSQLASKAGFPQQAKEYRQIFISTLLKQAGQNRDVAPGIYRRLGTMFKKEGKYDEARNTYILWSQEFPDDYSPLYRLFLLYEKDLKDPELARGYLERYQLLRHRDRAK